MERKTGAKILWGLFDPTAKDDARLSASAGQSFSSLNNVQSGLVQPYRFATLEENQIITDGSFIPFPERPINMGWWSKELSDENGSYVVPPWIEIEFEEYEHSTIGITIEFDTAYGDWPGETRIQWFDENDLIVAFGTFYPSQAKHFFSKNAEGYRRILIEFLGTSLPYRYIKVSSIEYGYMNELKDGEGLINASIYREVSPISDVIPVHELKFQFYSDSADYSPLNPEGVYKFLQQRQQIEAVVIENGTEIDMGTFYLDRWEEATAQSVSLIAVDIIGVMGMTDFVGGMYTGQTAFQVLTEIFTSAEAGFTISDELRNAPVYGHIPICNHREALQHVLFAINGVAHRNKGNYVEILPSETETKFTIGAARKFETHIQQNELVTGVSVVAHSYAKSNEDIELYNEQLTEGEHNILFSEPAHTIKAVGATIAFSNINMATITVSTPGVVTVTGKRYRHNQTTVAYEVTRNISQSAPNIRKVDSATLIHPGIVQALAYKLYRYYQNRYQSDIRFLPMLESTGDIVVMVAPDGGRLRGYLEMQEFDLIGGYIANGTVHGVPVEISHGDFMSEIYMGDEIGVI